jgi:hypothetical protein
MSAIVSAVWTGSVVYKSHSTGDSPSGGLFDPVHEIHHCYRAAYLMVTPVGVEPLGALAPSGRCVAKVGFMTAPTVGAEPHAAAREDRRSRRLHVLNGASAKAESSPPQPVGAEPLGSDCTVWTVRCQHRLNNFRLQPARSRAQLHVRIAALGGCTF